MAQAVAIFVLLFQAVNSCDTMYSKVSCIQVMSRFFLVFEVPQCHWLEGSSDDDVGVGICEPTSPVATLEGIAGLVIYASIVTCVFFPFFKTYIQALLCQDINLKFSRKDAKKEIPDSVRPPFKRDRSKNRIGVEPSNEKWNGQLRRNDASRFIIDRRFALEDEGKEDFTIGSFSFESSETDSKYSSLHFAAELAVLNVVLQAKQAAMDILSSKSAGSSNLLETTSDALVPLANSLGELALEQVGKEIESSDPQSLIDSNFAHIVSASVVQKLMSELKTEVKVVSDLPKFEDDQKIWWSGSDNLPPALRRIGPPIDWDHYQTQAQDRAMDG